MEISRHSVPRLKPSIGKAQKVPLSYRAETWIRVLNARFDKEEYTFDDLLEIKNPPLKALLWIYQHTILEKDRLPVANKIIATEQAQKLLQKHNINFIKLQQDINLDLLEPIIIKLADMHNMAIAPNDTIKTLHF